MWYKPYGKTGKQVSVIGFGGMRFEKPADIDASAEIVMHAYGRGINYFDTAPGYCDDHSEEIVGAALRRMKPGTFYVSTKSSKAKGDDLRAQLETSLKRLGVQKINFFHIWCLVTLEEYKERIEAGAVKAAVKAKEEGLIEHLVVSSHLPGEELAKVLAEGPFEGVTLGYCAINFPYRRAAVEAATKLKLGVVTMNPLGGGLIPQHADRFAFLKGPGDPSVTAAALRFNISHPGITCALVGLGSKQHIDESVAAVENFKPYDEAHMESIRKRLPEAFNGLCTGCGYCLPCPQGLAVPKFMDAYNHKLIGDGLIKRVVNRMKWHWDLSPQDARACSMCGACEERCTQRLPIRERMKEISQIVEEKK